MQPHQQYLPVSKTYLLYIQPVHDTVILKGAHYRTGKLMQIRFFVVDTKNKVIISHTACTQLGLLKYYATIRQPSTDAKTPSENTLLNQKTHPQKQLFTLSGHNTIVQPFQDHTTSILPF